MSPRDFIWFVRGAGCALAFWIIGFAIAGAIILLGAWVWG